MNLPTIFYQDSTLHKNSIQSYFEIIKIYFGHLNYTVPNDNMLSANP